MRAVPNNVAENGDVYRVHRDATLDGDDTKTSRPVVCVSMSPHDPVAWKGLPRITTTSMPGDLPSPATPDMPFTRDGHWTLRFLRAVRKDLTGDPALCSFLGTLSEPAKTEALKYYRGRNGTAAG
ncbi:hypothetical protein GCM10025875_31880 [Litorihabitans aurantiacus]|uniref:Uncharacterized protein n=1 Tax=Litorihabitans aurantiacus TaxID=1930061 RepID=A0AA37XGV5_9MICO|nr:hypothetical protein GCM10025875_31880 [Litorihabitans aurantiacus]